MVDVVFKKALKEFRLNIFNSYSTALAVCVATPSHFPVRLAKQQMNTLRLIVFNSDGRRQKHSLQRPLCFV